MYRAGDVDAFRPDYERFPLFQKASCLQFTVKPGDVLYYPKDWWHQTKNLDTPTIAITGTMVSRENYANVAEELGNQCVGKGRVFLPDDHMCPALERCYNLWAKTWSSL
jgi:hypothetical protein